MVFSPVNGMQTQTIDFDISEKEEEWKTHLIFDLFVDQNLMQSTSVKSHKLIAKHTHSPEENQTEIFTYEQRRINNGKCQWIEEWRKEKHKKEKQ